MADPGATDARLAEVTDQLGLLAYLEENFEGLETRLNGELLKQIPDNMKQRIVLARALVKSVPLYLFDNPGTHLDFEGDKKFMAMIEDTERQGHDHHQHPAAEPYETGGPGGCLKSGQIAMMGPPDQVVPALMGQPAKGKLLGWKQSNPPELVGIWRQDFVRHNVCCQIRKPT